MSPLRRHRAQADALHRTQGRPQRGPVSGLGPEGDYRSAQPEAPVNAVLLALQLGFQQHVLGAADASELLSGSAERRALGLAIYANAYRGRLLDALADAYVKTRSALGELAFEAAVGAYIDRHPPTMRSLRWYGDTFAEHLRTALPDQPAMAELARLDWALRKAFDGPGSAVLAAAELAGLPPQAWATLRLTLVPTCELLRFRYNTVAVWQAFDDEEAAPASAESAVEVDWLVWRKALQPHFRSLAPLEAQLLRAMQDGKNFAQACEQAQAECEGADAPADNDRAAQIGACLRQWLDDGVLSGVELGTLARGRKRRAPIPPHASTPSSVSRRGLR